ncbi:MAG: site-2 protease family protein, partial [Kiritimatiellae bacterium]|nr:site-2 protease family protein [Kiritimatiellia bacterium]
MESFSSFLVTCGYIAACVLLFALSIAIHEFGHFIAALKLGYRVERFSIGFGPAIWKKVYKGVEYRISWIPLGGYVSIPDVDPEGTKAIEGASASAKKIQMPAWKDFIVALAGPMMNIVLAFVLATLLYFVPSARFGVLPAKVGGIISGGAAEKGGLMEGDEVLSVGGNKVSGWADMITEVQFAAGRETDFEVRRGEEILTLKITPEIKENGVAYIAAISESSDQASCAMWMPSRGIVDQVAWDAGTVFRALKGLVNKKEMKNTAKALGGPVMIAKNTYLSVRKDVWDGIGFLRFINTNLAVMNLLPIPVLDGGLILFSLIAMVFRRRVPDKAIGYLSTFFMYILMGLMLLLVARDFWRLGKVEQKVEIGTVREAS